MRPDPRTEGAIEAVQESPLISAAARRRAGGKGRHTRAHASNGVTTTGRFNRTCRAVALIWLVVTIPAGLLHRPTDSDFQQFYLGGLAVRTGQADEIYPIHKP